VIPNQIPNQIPTVYSSSKKRRVLKVTAVNTFVCLEAGDKEPFFL
jgi:hypothetical protein